MYKQGQLIAVNGKIYEYIRKETNFHRVAEVEIDEDGYLTATLVEQAFTTEELKDDTIHLTKDQWYGIVAHFIRQDYDFEAEEIEEVTEDIVDRCFAYGIPKIHELSEYIADYLNR